MTTTEKRPDRRRERTLHLLSEALLDLLKEQDYANITIQDITDKANVSRATFYLHFRDKDELLFSSMKRIYDELSKGYPTVTRSEFTQVHDARDFEHVAAHADFYRAMLGAHGSPQFIRMVRAYLENLMREDVLKPLAPPDAHLPLDFIAAFMAGAEIGVINWWLNQGGEHTPEQMAQMMARMCLGGLGWALKLPVDPNDIPT